MNKKEFFEYIIPMIEDDFKNRGFIFKKSKGSFIKAMVDGWCAIKFTFYQFATTDNLIVSFALRNNSVEDILRRFIYVNPKDQKDSVTFGVTLTRLLNQRTTHFEFNSFTELDSPLDLK